MTATDFGTAVYDVLDLGPISVFALCDATGPTASPERVIVTCRERDVDRIRDADARLTAAGVERVWVTHRIHWSRTLDGIPWLPTVPSGDGRWAVSINLRAVPLPVAAAAHAAGDPELSSGRLIARRVAAVLEW